MIDLPSDDTWSFAILTPDAVVTDRLGELAAILRSHGFQLGACRLLELEWDRMGRMYTHSDVPPPSPAVEPRGMLPAVVMKKIYGLTPAVVVVVTHPEGDACARLLRCKGATKPEEAAQGTVRALGENQILNLMHCPDDAPSAAIELAYLVGKVDAEGLVARTLAGDTALALSGPDQLSMCLPAFTGWEAVSFPMIANRLHSRVVQWLGAHAGAGAIAPLTRAHDALVRERTALRAIARSVERMAVAQAALPAIHQALTEASAPGDIRDGLERLAALYDVTDPSIVLPLPDFPAEAIYLSPLEAMALDAHRRS
jgi:nucleoside diphosphate kinase